jgi:formylglycine-generating enzyme required for sulfatase activity/tRNA A-37 threonylcarbamoyl transferase component Bud32
MSSGVGVLEPGTVFARDFRVVRGLRTGGMGAVYVVDQMSTGKQRALKIMAPELAMDPATRERFVLEARAASRIESDHVVEIVTAGVDELTGAPYLVMELLRGEELAEALERTRRLSLGDVAEVLAQVGHALEQAHAHGIVHRDLKPENIFLAASKRRDTSFTAKVLDFGIAKLVADSVQKTGTQPLGTPLFMSPEQTDRKGRISPATDVWALGLIAFKLLTGRDFWLEADGSLPMLLREIVIEPIPYATVRARQFGVEALLPPGFDAWFVRCVNVDINARFPEAGAAVRAFAEIVAPDTQRGQLILAGGANVGSQPLAGQSGALGGPGSPAMGGFNTGPGAHPAAVSAGGVTYPQPSVSAGAPITPYGGAPPGAMYPSGPPAYGVSPQSSTTSPASLSGPAGNLAGGASPGSKAWLAIPLVLVIGGGLAFAGYKLLGPGAAPAGSTQAGPGSSGAAVASSTGATPESSAKPAAGAGTTCPDGLAFVKGGKMFMGARDLSDDAKPPHSVTVSSFCIDKKEVTTAEYDACFEKTECERPLENVSWRGISSAQEKRYSPLCNGMKKDRDAHPINCVAWSMADNFCKKRGARLPTEAEWEYAARGSRQRTYPWGDEAPGAKHLNACGKECAKWGADNKDAKMATMHGEDDGYATTAPAGSFPAGATAEGVLDLAGNVWEWTADWHAPYPATEGMADPKGAETGTKRVARGGDFTSSDPDWAKPAWRWKTEPDTYNHAIGFRCAMEPRP